MKGLEALEHLNKNIIICEDIDEDIEIIRKELKALEIIKQYICVGEPFGGPCYIYLNDESEMISDEEYNLLKEVLTDGD